MQRVRSIGSAAVRAASFSVALSLPFLLDAAPAEAWTFKVLHTFQAHTADGNYPRGISFNQATGKLYGETQYGGASNHGTVFQLSTNGSEKILYSFTGGADGSYPFGQLVKDEQGNYYGTTGYGGDSRCPRGDRGCGVIYKLTPKGALKVLHSFLGGAADGAIPEAGLFRDASTGDLYGTTVYGGAADYGTVFRLAANGSFDVLYSFLGGTDGAYPRAAVTVDANKNVYGTTHYGGDAGCVCGTVFKLTATGEQSTLYTFTDRHYGYPLTAVTLGPSGSLYGTGAGRNSKNGSLFKLTSGGKFKLLIGFKEWSTRVPLGDLLLEPSGTIYGTTDVGGNGGYGYGTVFQVNPDGSKSELHVFTGGEDGAGPQTGVVEDEAGNLYGTAIVGGDSVGTVFMLKK